MLEVGQDFQLKPESGKIIKKTGDVFRPLDRDEERGTEKVLEGEGLQFGGIPEAVGIHMEELAGSGIEGVNGVGGTSDGLGDAKALGKALDERCLSGAEITAEGKGAVFGEGGGKCAANGAGAFGGSGDKALTELR